jgi:twitching motility protein PilT
MAQDNEMKEIDRLLSLMQKFNATDLHLKAGSPPIFRIARVVRRMETEPLTGDQVKQMVYEMLMPKFIAELERTGNADFAYSIPGVGRFRVNVFKQRGSVSMAARRVFTQIPTLKELHLPECLCDLCQLETGLVIVAGVTGSGKTTTLASLISIINQTRRCHILTIEDPIEYLHKDELAFINQREVGLDVESYSAALKYMVREDPDVILIGELRDAESFEAALVASETGHLVLGAMHAASAAQSIGRMLDLFPPERHQQIRTLLEFNLRAFIVQKLLKGAKKETPLVPAVEIMLVNPTIRKLIRERADDKIPDVIQASRELGMQTMNQSLEKLVKDGYILDRVALEASPNPESLRMSLSGIKFQSDRGAIVS